MEIKQINKEDNGYFKAEENGIQSGKLTYTWAGKEKFIIDHTEVNPDFRGKNIGKQLIMAAVTFARESKVKIIPVCSYAKSVFDKTDEIKDVLF